ncbi:MAG: hypothetical protein M1827_000686 [Pycnora praestabilis]|nr:MAG: hypothetical protein M1827_000686 [Pycnora praestabilis]
MISKYAAAHASPNGPGDSRPTALQIVKDEGLEGKLTGKVIFITGCSSGIGIETARALSTTGATLFLTARDMVKGKGALQDILEQDRVHLLQLDLDSLASVRACVKDFLAKSKTLNVLIDNAGIMCTPEGKTADGFEKQFGTNHLAHFLLFNLLKPTLLASSTNSFNSRVVALSSTAHRDSGVHFDNLGLEGIYEPGIAYGQSKTANIYMANEIDRRYGAQGLHGLSLTPGGIYTGLQQHIPEEMMDGWRANEVVGKIIKSSEQGAATTVWAAVGKEWEGHGGKYLEDCAVSKPAEPGWNVMSTGYEKWAYDPENESRLWKASLKMVGLDDDH